MLRGKHVCIMYSDHRGLTFGAMYFGYHHLAVSLGKLPK